MTEPRFLLDTNCLVYLVEDGSEPLVRRASECAEGELVTSSIAYAEFARGIDWSQNSAAQTVDRLFRAIPILDFDQIAARCYADLPFRRAAFDRLIAAHALALDLILVTANVKDFRDIPDLKIEDWSR